MLGSSELSNMIAPDTIEARRVRGERPTTRRWDHWLRMGTDPCLMVTRGGVWTEAQAREKLEWIMRQWVQNGHGQWLFFLKNGECLIGRCGIRKRVVNAKEEVERGYAVMSDVRPSIFTSTTEARGRFVGTW
jgi:RimJ/RimL family protein N-acetyltransferase